VQQHLLQQHFAGVLHAQSYHGKAIADKDDVHAGSIGDMGAGEVMGCDHGDWLALFM